MEQYLAKREVFECVIEWMYDEDNFGEFAGSLLNVMRVNRDLYHRIKDARKRINLQIDIEKHHYNKIYIEGEHRRNWRIKYKRPFILRIPKLRYRDITVNTGHPLKHFEHKGYICCINNKPSTELVVEITYHEMYYEIIPKLYPGFSNYKPFKLYYNGSLRLLIK